MKKLFLALVVLLAFGLRLYRIDFPLADWHSWRQADTAAVSRNYLKGDFNLLRPRFDDLSNVASGLDNPEGYRFVEFPLYNLFHAFLAELFPFFNLVVWGRLLSVFFSLGSLIFLYLITGKFLGERIGLWAAFFFAVLPFNVYYGRVILPEPMMVFTGLGMTWFFARWFEKTGSFLNLWLAVVFAGASWLIKPFSLVYLLPVAYLAWQRWRFEWKKYLPFVLGVLISLLPFIAWRWWMGHFPEGIPRAVLLFNLTKIRFKGAFFWWLFAERIGRLILGGWGLVLLGFGLAVKTGQKEGLFSYAWLAAVLVYFSIVAGGNVQHDYYQVLAVPIICVFLAKGADFLLSVPGRFFSGIACRLLLATVVLFMLAFSWYQVRDFFNINNPAIVRAGQAVDRGIPPQAKVIAPYGGDTAFLFQTNRPGWPVGIEIEKMIELGATHYVNVNLADPEVEWLAETYCVLEKDADYIIIDLTRKCPV